MRRTRRWWKGLKKGGRGRELLVSFTLEMKNYDYINNNRNALVSCCLAVSFAVPVPVLFGLHVPVSRFALQFRSCFPHSSLALGEILVDIEPQNKPTKVYSIFFTKIPYINQLITNSKIFSQCIAISWLAPLLRIFLLFLFAAAWHFRCALVVLAISLRSRCWLATLSCVAFAFEWGKDFGAARNVNVQYLCSK